MEVPFPSIEGVATKYFFANKFFRSVEQKDSTDTLLSGTNKVIDYEKNKIYFDGEHTAFTGRKLRDHRC